MAETDAAITALANVATSAMNYGEKKGAQKRNFEYSKQYFDYTFDKQNERQDYLNANQMSILKNSYRDAGLSVASLGDSGAKTLAGASPTGSTQSFAQDAYQADFSEFMNGLLTLAQIKNVDADTKSKQIDNNRKEDEDSKYNQLFDSLTNPPVLDDEEKNFIGEIGEGEMSGGVLDEIKSDKFKPRKTKGWFDAYNSIDEFNAESTERKSRIVKAKFDSTVYQMQLDNPQVVKALVNMPKETFNSVVEQYKLWRSTASLNDSQKAYTDFQKQLQEDNNIMPYLNKLFDGDFTFKDFGKGLILVLMKCFGKM